MNRIFRIVWSQAQCAWVVVSELAMRRGKRGGGVDSRVAVADRMGDRNLAEAGPPTGWPLRASVLLALASLYAPAQAADRYWDVNGTAVGRGGTGTWNLSSSLWSPNGDGVSGPYSAWNNATLDNAFFGGTAGTVTLGTPISVHNLTFETSGYTLTGSTLTLGGTTPTIAANSGNTSINSVIAGSAGLVKAGNGNLFLNGVNTFSGGIAVNGGGLYLNANAALGSAGNGVTMANGTLLSSSGALAASRVVTLTSGTVALTGAGVGSARFTGAGGVNARNGVTLSNNASDYTGGTSFSTPSNGGNYAFTSIADAGVASSVGAGSSLSASSGGGVATTVRYYGSGNSSNRNWSLFVAGAPAPVTLVNAGTGALTLTGNIALNGTNAGYASFNASSADLGLLGVISGTQVPTVLYTGSGAGRTITLGGANTYTRASTIQNVTVRAGVLANTGSASSLGTGTAGSIYIAGNGVLSYVGAGDSSNRALAMNDGTLNNDGSGALALSGTLGITNTATLGGSFTGADNLYSGVISGSGGLRSNGAGTWVLGGTNTYTGSTTVTSGTLRAGSADAFGASSAFVVNGGTLDLNDFDRTAATLAGTGGTVDLGSATLTLNAASGVNTTYAGNITGSGGLTKLGASNQTLTGSNIYTGDTTVGGGSLTLDFTTAGGPTSNIISSASTLNMAGGRLNVNGAAGEADTQTFDGLNVTAGNNVIDANSGTGGSMTVNLGAISHTGGLVNFELPGSGNITTSNTTLGGWATVNGTDYAKVVGGNITAFTSADYTDKDNAANWLDNEFITDVAGFYGTVNGSVQLGGLRYTAPVSTTVTVQPGETLGVDGAIIVAPTVSVFGQTITGGSLTGMAGGGTLGIQQNSTGNFSIASQIVDNGGGIGFTKAGTGLVTLTNANNSYTGATRVAQGTLAVSSIGNGGVASGIGASTADASNLVLQGGTLRYTGASTSSDRGFTLAKSGAILGGTVEVSNAATNLAFGGLVTSSDGASLTKTGPGTLTLSNDTNDYTGATTITGGTLSVDTLANGGLASGIGASTSASSNLVLDGGELEYTGATATSDRGFTLGANDGAIDVTDAATTLTLSGTAARGPAGSDTLIKRGEGTLVLSGTNTYSGGNIVNGGILRAGSTQAFGTAATMTLANSAGVALDLAGFNNTIGALNGGGASGGNVSLGSATLTIQGGTGSYAGSISGTGGIRQTAGNQTMVGCNNTYTGATTVQNANLWVDCLANGGVASGIGASSSASSNLSLNQATLVYTGGTVTTDRGLQVSNTGAINVNNAATTLEFGGPVIGSGLVRKDGPGTLVLSGNNTHTGGTQVTAGTLRAGSTTAFGTGAMIVNNTAGALLDLDGFNNTVATLNGGGAAGGNVELDAGTLTLNFAGSVTATYAGAISGSGGLVKAGGAAYTQVLSGCNSSYTGATVVNGGVLQVNCLENGGANSSIGATTSDPANLVLNGGTLRYSGSGDSTDRQFTLGTSGGALDASGTGTINFSNIGAVTLAGTNAARTLTLTGTNSGDNVFSAQLTNNGTGLTSLTKTGTGTWRLTNSNSTYTGVTSINGGVLSVDQLADGGLASSIGASSNAAANLVIGNGSTLRYTGAGDSTNRLFSLNTGVTFIESSGTGAIDFNNTAPVTLLGTNTARTIALGGTNTDDNTMGGAIGNNGTGATTLAKNGSGTWILTGNNTYTGNTVINDGNLMIGNGGTTGNAGAGNVIIDSATSTLSLNRSDTFTFSGTLSGPGTLAQVGSGTSVLTSTSSSVGATAIDAGTLQVDGTLATPTVDMTGASALTVNGTLQATGPTQTVISGDAGNQTIDLNAGGTLLASGDLGAGSDVLDLTGTLNTGTAALSLGDSDDTLLLHDGAAIAGVGVTGGVGSGDNLVIDNALALAFSGTGISGFEQLTKQNSGVLTTTGTLAFSAGTLVEGGTLAVDGSLETPSVAMSDGTTMNVDGVVETSGATPTTLTGSSGSNTVVVGSSGTLRAAGDLGGGSDSVTLAGLLDSGAGTLGLGDGDDVLTLSDGVSISGTGVDAGTGNDLLRLDSMVGLTFDGSQTAGFEDLLKLGDGVATMTGSQSFTGGTTISAGTLAVGGVLETPTLNLADGTALSVSGTVQSAPAMQATITGSAGDNTVTVGSGGTLLAHGDLGDGNDVLDVAGTLATGFMDIFDLGTGDDTFVVHDNTQVTGTVAGGSGTDTLNANIATSADLGTMHGFETLTKSGGGVLNINGPGVSEFAVVNIDAGTLNVTSGAVGALLFDGPQATTIAGGATLNVESGAGYGCGSDNDTLTVSGTVSGAGAVDQCEGDDTLTVNDGATFASTTAISGGDSNTGDTVVLNNAFALALDGADVANYELLVKQNAGTATLTGSHSFSGGSTISSGTLDVDGTLETPTVAMFDDTVLSVDGAVQGAAAAPTTIAGSAGANTVAVGASGLLRATGDLGGGADTLDVSGTLDTNGGVFQLGDGNDNFVVHDGSVVLGTVDGGAGLDTRTYDINTTASLGALANFEGVTKTGTGVLTIAGPGTTALQQVEVLGGVLDVAAGASVVATAGSPLATTVASGATLNVDGAFGCGTGNDSLSVSGALSGSGTVDLCGGDDVLTLNDGADLSGLAGVIDASAGIDDTLVLNDAGALALDAGDVANFEVLRKDNAGEATLTGAHGFSGGVLLNGGTLSVADSLTTPTVAMDDGTVLDVDGTLQAVGGTATAVTGSAGVNTVNVAAGALLVASGDLGDGADVLSVAGTLDSAGGVFSLGAGEDRFMVYDTTDTTNATIDGGLGNDTLDVTVSTGNTVPLGTLSGFESLGKSGAGALEIHGPSSFIDVTANAGTLRVTDTGSIAATNTTILSGATLELADAGSYSGTSGADTFTVAGTIVSTGTQAGTLDLGAGDDVFTLQDGADLSGLATPVSGGTGTDAFVADLAGSATLGGAVGFETLTKTNIGTLLVAGPAASSFTTVNVDGGTLDIGAAGNLSGVQNASVASGATLNVDGVFGFTPGADTFTVAGNVSGLGSIDMLDGDDTLTVRDGANLSGLLGPVDGGTGTDTLLADIATAGTLGGAIDFETLIKDNAGTLTIAGPASSQFDTVLVQGGTLLVAGTATVDPQTTVVSSGSTLTVNGTYTGTTGDDTFDVSGTVNGSGTIDLLAGDDVLTLHDGANIDGLANPLDGGAHSAGDTVVLDNANALSANLGNTVNFEFLQKDNAGEATLTGSSSFSGGTTVNAGTLTVAGTLETPTVALADDTVLNVDGLLQGSGGGQADITGSAGSNTVTVGAGGTLLASGDLGAGEDLLDVRGTLDTGAGSLVLGDGNDNFIVHDGTQVLGTVDGGAGLDTRTYDINLTADLGALTNFEGVTKTGTGTLNIGGPGTTDLQEVRVLGGTLNVGALASVAATPGTVLNTLIGTGATLNVDGSYGCGDGNDSMSVSGTLSGSGTVDLCGGDDTLTLNDGAVLANVVDGGAHSAGDTVILNNANALSVDASNTINFEFLQKDNAGEATLTGISSFSGGTTVNAGTLTVAGTLETPTVALADDSVLNVDGLLQGSGGGQADITGSAGSNTVMVGAGGTLLASGDLGAGEDLLDVRGTLDTGSGVFALGDGNDTFTVHDGTVVGTVDGGAGLDTRVYDINLTADLGALTNFEGVTKTGTGTLNIGGPGTTDLQEVRVLGGTLNVGALASVAATPGTVLNTLIGAGTTLNVDGNYGCGDGNDTMTVAGTVSGSGTIDLCGGDDTLTLQDGAVLDTAISGGSHGSGDTVVLDTTNAFTFDAANTINFEFLQKDNAGEATLVGAQAFTGGTTINGGTLTVAGQLETPTVAMADDTVLNVDGTLQAAAGAATAITGSAGANTVTVGEDGTLLATGDLGGGADVLDVAGTLDTGSGRFELGDGDDTLTIHDNTNIVGTVVAGAGNDTFNADIDTVADLGAVQAFETLSKTGEGVLNVNGPMSSDFNTVNVLDGTLNVTAGGSVMAQTTTVAAGATLDVTGSYTGTSGDDSFTSMGTVRGAFDFGDGNDRMDFTGGDPSGVTRLAGGVGEDRLSFSGLDISAGATELDGWERVSLLDGSSLTLDRTLGLGNGLLTLDSTSSLLARAGASIGGSVQNDGLIDVSAQRLAISGDYSGDGLLNVQVATSSGASGGLDIDGDVRGTTRVNFTADGTEAKPGTTIRVISSPNDDPGTAGSFVANGPVRLPGSVLAWSFGQGPNDPNWYLSSADNVLLPEISGYAVVPDISYSMVLDSNRLLFDRMAGVRGDNPYCQRSAEERLRMDQEWFGGCEGVWIAATGSHLSMEDDPGFEFDGNSTGLYGGFDHLFMMDAAYKLRGGVFVGQQRGNYSTTGHSSSGMASSGDSNVDMDALTFGLYGSVDWKGGSYLDMTLTGLLPEADIVTSDGFSEDVQGNTLSLTAQGGHRFALDDGWMVEPQLQVGVVRMSWDDKTDASGKQLNLKDDVLEIVRTAVRVEKTIQTDGGSTIRPWLTVGLQDTLGENSTSLEVALPGADGTSQRFPGHDLGASATLDVGLEAQVAPDLKVFGTASVIGASLGGSSVDQQQVSVGVRWTW